jgi:predicted PurR-regulated permease PerM
LGVEERDDVLTTVEKTTRGVSRGVMGTALIQAMIAWIGFVIVGAPASVLLSFICLILCSIQLGIIIVGLPIAVWLWVDGRWESAVFIVAWSVFVSVIDNFLKPILLGHDLPAPIWILFLGIIGGLLSMGLIGLFMGPILLSISYQFIVRWAQP